MSGKLRLGVNIDHVATVRNARGSAYPDPIRAAKIAEDAGADGITAHLREDRRHISDADIEGLMAVLTKPLNFEMAATDEMQKIALRHRVKVISDMRDEILALHFAKISDNQILVGWVQPLASWDVGWGK